MPLIRVIVATILLGMSTLAQAGAILTLVPDTTSVAVTATSPGVVTYTVTNTTGVLPLTGITIEPNFAGGNSESMSLSADTCSGSTLAPAASCVFTLTITAANQPSSFTLSPRVCGLNQLACSQATENNRPAVTVNPPISSLKAYMALNDRPPAVSAIQPILIANQELQPLITGLDFSLAPPYVGLTLSQDGTTLYVSNTNGQTLDIFDISGTPTLVSSTPVGLTPEGMAVTDDKKTVYLVDSNSGWIYIIDTATQGITYNYALTAHSPAAPFTVAISPDQSKYYVPDFLNGIVYGFNTSDNSPLSPNPTYSGINNPFYVLVSNDNQRLYLVDPITGTVYVLDANNLTLITSFLSTVGAAYSLALSPDGSLLYVGLKRGVAVYETVGYTLVNSALPGNTLNSLSVDSTGNTLYGTTWGDTTVYSFDTHTLTSTPITMPGPVYNLSTKFIQ
jgi:DNA-binding beta-propeller fold protein YncE